MKKILSFFAVLAGLPLYAQQDTLSQEASSALPANMARNLDLNLLLRSSLELPTGGQAGVRVNEARVEVRGTLVPQLSYRVRYRLNRSTAQRSQDNASSSIDHASITYAFGKNRAWGLTAGKQSALVGNWEFDNNPTFEYQYSELVNRQLNIFLTALKLTYSLNENHTLGLQLHNTYNDSFPATLQDAGYEPGGLEAARLPVGLYVAWLGKLFGQKLHTFYSYNVSQFARGKTNHAVAIGNKLLLPRFQAYLDLATASYGAEYFGIASPALNQYRIRQNPNAAAVLATDLRYNNAVLRLDYEFVPRWFVTAKGIWEAASQPGTETVGRNFRTNVGYLGGLEYKPVGSQDMRLFAYYYNGSIRYHHGLAQTSAAEPQSLFAFGMFYFLKAL